jgi:spore germination protein
MAHGAFARLWHKKMDGEVVMKIRFCFMLLFISFILNGCAQLVQQPSLEDLGMIGVMGFDDAGKDKMKVTVTVPQPSDDAMKKTQIYSIDVVMVHEAIVKLSAQAERTLTPAQLRVIIIGDELAKKRGVGDVIKHLYRDPLIGDNVFVAVVEGSAEKLLKAEYPDKPNINTYLNNLLHPRESTAFNPFTTIHDFVYDLTNEVTDPIAPYLVKEGKDIQIAKIAVFKGDKLVGNITPEEAKIVQGLQNVVQIPSFLLPVHKEKGSEEFILIDFVKTDFAIRSNGNLNSPVITLDLYLRGSVVEYTGEKNFENDKERNKLLNAIEQELKKQTEMLLEKFRKENIDPIGLSKSLRQEYRGDWSEEKGRAALQRAKYKVLVEAEIISTGTIK